MSTYNPAALYFFTACLRLTEGESTTYHAILETITRERSSEKDILVSIKNIILCDAPFQIYSFPHVLNVIFRLDIFHVETVEIIRNYVVTLESFFQKAQRVQFSDLFNKILRESTGKEALGQFIQLLETVPFLSNESSDEIVIFPYIDIVEFAAEALLLSLLNWYCKKQDNLNALQGHLDEKTNSRLSHFLSQAYAHKTGRASFLQSVEIYRQLFLLTSPEVLGKHFWRNKLVSSSPDLEPDLVYLFLETWFIFQNRSISDKDRLGKIRTELESFHLYEQCVDNTIASAGNEKYKHKKNEQYLRLYYGKDPNDQWQILEKQAISVNIWVGSIYLLVNENFDTDNALSLFLLMWGPLEFGAPGIKFPKMRYGDINRNVARHINNKTGGDPSTKQLLEGNLRIFSPWLVFSKGRYINLNSFPDWLRTLYAIQVAKSLIIKCSYDKTLQIEPFVGYIFHVDRLLLFAADIIRNPNCDTKGPMGSAFAAYPQLRKIFLFLDRDLNYLIGSGMLEQVDYEIFFSFLTKDQNAEYIDKKTISLIIFKWYYKSLQWQQYIVDDMGTPVRQPWFGRNLNPDYQIQLNLFRKYVFDSGDDHPIMGGKKVDQILLLQPKALVDVGSLSEFDFIKGAEDEKEGVATWQTVLAIAIKRYEYSLRYGLPDVEFACRTDLERMLKLVRRPQDIGYLHRIVLISLFDHYDKISDDNKRLFELIIDILFEFKGIFDISFLTSKILGRLHSDIKVRPSNAQIDILTYLSDSVSIAMKLNTYEQSNGDIPMDPIANHRQHRKIDFLRHTINTIQFLRITFNTSSWKNRIHNYYQTEEECFDIVNADVSIRNSIPVFELPEIGQRSCLPLLSLITYNNVMQTAQFYFQIFQLPDNTYNFLIGDEEQHKKVFEDKSSDIYCVGICVEEQTRLPREPYKFQIRAGWKPMAPICSPVRVLPGQIARLRFKAIRDLFNKLVVDQTFCETLQVESTIPPIQIRSLEDFVNLNLPLRVWLPCHSDIHTRYINKSISWGVPLYLTKDRRPKYYYFNWLIFSLTGSTKIIPLTFVSREWDKNRGEYGYLFYLEFGRYFLIFEDEILTNEDGRSFLECLTDILDSDESDISALNGLIISFYFRCISFRPFLTFCSVGQSKDPAIEQRFPHLTLPFDKRNIDWTNLFDEDVHEHTAHKLGNEWFYNTGKKWADLGFPKTLPVSFEKKLPANKNSADFQLRGGWVNGDDGRFKLHLSVTIIEWSFIDTVKLKKYLQLAANMTVQINGSWHLDRNASTYSCYVKDGYKAFMHADTCTLLPLSQSDFEFSVNNVNFAISFITDWSEVEIELDGFIPPEEFIYNNILIAYFTSVPRDAKQRINTCSILFEDPLDNDIKSGTDIHINNINSDEVRKILTVPARFVGRLVNKVWKYYIASRRIFLRPLWKLKLLTTVEAGMTYVGEATIKNKKSFAFEDRNQRWTLFHCDSIENNEFKNILFDTISEVSPNWVVNKLTKKRISFGFDGLFISGSLSKEIIQTPHQNISLREILIKLDRVEGESCFVRRVLEVECFRKIQGSMVNRTADETNLIRRQKALDAYFEQPCDLFGTLDINSFEIAIAPPSSVLSVPSAVGWINKIAIEDGAIIASEDLVFVPAVIRSYSTINVPFRLVQWPDGSITATLKRPFSTIDDLFDIHKNILDGDPLHSNKLFFVGRESEHPVTKQPYECEMYRFEQGFGKNILIPANRLLWFGSAIETGDLQLFHSDAVVAYNFTRSEEGDSEVIKLNILQINISHAHRLYIQAAKHNIYHYAHVGKNKLGVYIKYVRGADDRAMQKQTMVKVYNEIYAKFDSQSEGVLKKRFEDDPTCEERIVLVKVDIDVFKRTERLEFNHYKLTFIERDIHDTYRILDDKARIIMVLGSIGQTRSKNDYFIHLTESPIDEEDKGEDFMGARILRRDFSLNEGLLRGLFRLGQSQFFNGDEVYLTARKTLGDNLRTVTFSLVSNPIFRDQKVLLGFKNIVGISRSDDTNESPLVVEVKPGNFLELDKCNVNLRTKSVIKKYDILNIQIQKNPFVLDVESAIAGDYQFLIDGRKIVGFPKDSLFHENRPGTKQYTIGGLPNIEIGIDSVDFKHQNDFLSQPHPKIAIIKRLVYKPFELLRLTLSYQDCGFGFIFIDKQERDLKFVCTHNSREDYRDMAWNKLSFSDVSAAEIIARIRINKWRYHDEQTWDLIKTKTAYVPGPPYNIRMSSISDIKECVSGPLFCEFIEGTVNLRYRSNLLKWAFPVSSLIDFLDLHKDGYEFWYAGKFEGVHFIEIAPGRIAELPINLLLKKIDNVEISLYEYAWDFLRIGDRVTLKNISSELSDLYKIELLSIEHCFRNVVDNAFKTSIESINQEQGYIELGSVPYTIRRPISRTSLPFDITKRVAFFIENNNIVQNHQASVLVSGDTVLVTLANDGKFRFLGYDKLYPRPLNLMEITITEQLIQASGGVIPATVVFDSMNRVRFKHTSLTEQIRALNGKIVCGYIVNLLSPVDGDLVIRIGGYLQCVSLETIISGVPRKHMDRVAQSLRGKDVWLKVTSENGNLSFNSGFIKESVGSEIFVSKVCQVLDVYEHLIGSVYQSLHSQRYYWMPQEEMAWSKINKEIEYYVTWRPIEDSITGAVNPIKVAIVDLESGCSISRIRTQELLSSFNKKRCGADNIDLIIISDPKQVQQQYSFFGYSILHKILVECSMVANRMETPTLFESINAQVVQKDNLCLKLSVVSGKRSVQVRIPIYKNSKGNSATGLRSPGDEFVLSIMGQEKLTREQQMDITNLCSDILAGRLDSPIGLKPGIILLKMLCSLQNTNPKNDHIINQIESFLLLIRHNLLRLVCIDILNESEPFIRQDQYLDMKIIESLQPFLANDVRQLSEWEYRNLKRTALSLRFQYDRKYVIIGNSILQALGLKSHLDAQALGKSGLFAIYNLLRDYRKNNEGEICPEFFESLSACVDIIDAKGIRLNLLIEEVNRK